MTTRSDATLLRAQLDACLAALRDVMSTLSSQAGSPSEVKAWNAARALLVEHGIGTVERREWIDRKEMESK